MIVERVPTSPRSPAGRALRLAGLAAPVVLLAGVVAAGVLGPRTEVPVAVDAATAPPAVAPEAPASAAPAPGDAPDGESMSALVTFPRTVLGLPVLSVASTQEVHRRNPFVHIAAVAGYLTIQGLGPDCADRWLGTFPASCDGRAVLADSPTQPYPSSTGGGAGFAALGAHLHPQFPPGVRLPRELVAGVVGDGSPGLRRPATSAAWVVVLGRFAPQVAGHCAPDRSCDEEFTVERVAWVDGKAYHPPTMIGPGLMADWSHQAWRDRLAVARAALGRDRMPLNTAYLEHATLRLMDPAAADAVGRALADGPAATAAPVGTALWYVRGLQFDDHAARSSSGKAAPRIVWVVVEDATGRVLARGTEAAGGSGSS